MRRGGTGLPARPSAGSGSRPAPRGVLAAAIVEERERTEAVRLVLQALVMSIGWLGLRRRLFLSRIARLGRETPDSGPQAARHAVLLAESRRVLGTPAADPPTDR